jgi:hypothetical protein
LGGDVWIKSGNVREVVEMRLLLPGHVEGGCMGCLPGCFKLDTTLEKSYTSIRLFSIYNV